MGRLFVATDLEPLCCEENMFSLNKYDLMLVQSVKTILELLKDTDNHSATHRWISSVRPTNKLLLLIDFLIKIC